jgi:hypothetical protein
MKKLLIGLMVFALSALRMQAMEMETAKNKSSTNACGNAVKACCYLTAACGLLTSGQPMNAKSADMVYKSKPPCSYDMATIFAVAGILESDPLSFAQTWPCSVAAKQAPSQCILGNAVSILDSSHYKYNNTAVLQYTECAELFGDDSSQWAKKRSCYLLIEELNRKYCQEVLAHEEEDRSTWNLINDQQKHLHNHNYAREIQKPIEDRITQRSACRLFLEREEELQKKNQ